MNLSRTILLTAAITALSGPAWSAETIKLVERPINETTVDLGAKGDSVGDLLTFANPVYDAANKAQVGTDQGYCVRVAVGKSWECIWTLILKSGQITVTGGTGKYSGAKGSMKLHPRDATPTGYDFTYLLK